ncbi:MAG: hypothetical protein IIC71_13905 [Acidobacteria bacterium]|nr:hypothetical protein [Acidobacteriota bacterium]
MTTIRSVDAATIRMPLEQPLDFGTWEIAHREYCVVRITSTDGDAGFGFGLTRDGSVDQIVETAIRPLCVGQNGSDPAVLIANCEARNRALLGSGIGLRALSLVEIALWDLRIRTTEETLEHHLGGEPIALPAVAIIGYPPTASADAVAREAANLYGRGWRHFKIPVAATTELTIERVQAVAASGGSLALDGAWSFRSVTEAADLLRRLECPLAWFEDPFQPGDVQSLTELKQETDVRIGVGDEQGGPYFPDALLEAGVVDVLRLDATCIGGISRFRSMALAASEAGLLVSPHMAPHLHARVIAGLGLVDSPIEWGFPASGVEPLTDPWERPRLDNNGRMRPLADSLPAPRAMFSHLQPYIVRDLAGILQVR